jgi:hypothetical protein
LPFEFNLQRYSVDQGHARLCTLMLKYNRRTGKMSVPEVGPYKFANPVYP